ncbi:MAG: sensor histidine kinase N-terminal domain-containing protein, partial [Planctomycetota bacterium]
MTSRPHSLSRRLTLALVLAAVALIGGAQVFTEHQARTRLCADFDRGLLQKAQTLATLVEQEHGRVEFDYVARLHPEFERDQEPDYLQVAMANGTVLLRSRHLAHDLEFSRSRGEPWYGDATLGDGRDVRYVVFPFHAELAPNAAAGEAPHELVLAVLRGVEPLRAALA